VTFGILSSIVPTRVPATGPVAVAVFNEVIWIVPDIHRLNEEPATLADIGLIHPGAAHISAYICDADSRSTGHYPVPHGCPIARVRESRSRSEED
jgi:hypothetical protein